MVNSVNFLKDNVQMTINASMWFRFFLHGHNLVYAQAIAIEQKGVHNNRTIFPFQNKFLVRS
jgi:hypothetical protein